MFCGKMDRKSIALASNSHRKTSSFIPALKDRVSRGFYDE